MLELIPELNFVKAFKNEEGRNFFHLNLQGLARGEGVVVEVISGFEDYFETAPTLNLDLPKMPEALSKLSRSHLVEGYGLEVAKLVLQGPLNETMDLAGLGFQIEIDLRYIDQFEDPNQSLFTTYIEFSEVARKQTLGDYLGLSAARLAAARMAGLQSFKRFGSRLESL